MSFFSALKFIFYQNIIAVKTYCSNNPEQYSLRDTYAKILGSIGKRLESDFYISGPNKGQFGKGRKHIAEDRHYQSNGCVQNRPNLNF